MSEWVELHTSTGPVRAWLARPDEPPKGAVVVVQEIFGVNPHIRQVTDRLAAPGYLALAPALYDPVEPGVELAYDGDSLRRGRELRDRLGYDRALACIDAARQRLANECSRVGVVGFCWGGTLAFLANTRLGLPAVSYYGAQTVPFLSEPARAPMLFHFGEHDPSIDAAAIAQHRDAQPGAQIHLYPAGHAFNRDVDPAVHEPASAALAWQRTLAFFGQVLR